MFLKSQAVQQIGLGTQPLPDGLRGRTGLSTMYSIRSTSMKRKALIETVSPEARDFSGADTPKPQSPVLLPQTFRLPQRLIDDLVRAGELRALSWLDREGNTWLPINPKSTLP
jgi:hypothetical protein